ncbi:MAG: hypothetical protein IJ146_02790 [Kiritimatiellae bacterium]|nr:hypothetical protein [Kiritimatiellia bacterium]
MRTVFTAFLFLCGIVAHAPRPAPCPCDAAESALGAETGVGMAAGVAVGIYGSDVAFAGHCTMVNGVPQDTLTSQGLQAADVNMEFADGSQGRRFNLHADAVKKGRQND